MDPTATGRQRFGRAATRIVQAAAMAAVVTVGVAALSLFPHPRQAPAPVRVAAAVAAPALVPAAVLAPSAPPLRPRISPAPRHPAAVKAERAPIAVVAVRRPPAACRGSRLAADRLVCSRPALASLDRRMRAAYARAVAAGGNRLEIDRGQARWHGARDRATEADSLTRLYQRRIADLEAAAAHPPPRTPSGGQA